MNETSVIHYGENSACCELVLSPLLLVLLIVVSFSVSVKSIRSFLANSSSSSSTPHSRSASIESEFSSDSSLDLKSETKALQSTVIKESDSPESSQQDR